MPESGKLLYSTAEACARLNIGKTKLFELLSSGELESVTIGSARLVPADDLEDFVSRLRTGAGSPERVEALLSLVDARGRVDVSRIPKGTTLADLEAAKRLVAEPQGAA